MLQAGKQIKYKSTGWKWTFLGHDFTITRCIVISNKVLYTTNVRVPRHHQEFSWSSFHCDTIVYHVQILVHAVPIATSYCLSCLKPVEHACGKCYNHSQYSAVERVHTVYCTCVLPLLVPSSLPSTHLWGSEGGCVHHEVHDMPHHPQATANYHTSLKVTVQRQGSPCGSQSERRGEERRGEMSNHGPPSFWHLPHKVLLHQRVQSQSMR